MTISCAGTPETTRMSPPSASPPSSSGGQTLSSITSELLGPWGLGLGLSPARRMQACIESESTPDTEVRASRVAASHSGALVLPVLTLGTSPWFLLFASKDREWVKPLPW
jgi:hypothetical protein